MRAVAVIRSWLHGRQATAAATRDSASPAFDVGSEVDHKRFGHGTIVRLYHDREIASAEVMFGNGNVRSLAATSLTKALPQQPRAVGRGTEREAPAGSSPNPLNAAR
jgi:hypothetical protein